MVTRALLGEFEQRVLLAILRCRDEPTALEVRRELERVLGREVSRGAFYTTLERLEAKGRLTWSVDRRSPTGAGAPERRLEVTRQGRHDLRVARRSLLDLWRGLEDLLDEGGR
jgi:DNA-binding PadR family transcriptional regulator